jgi:hypothetical protein
LATLRAFSIQPRGIVERREAEHIEIRQQRAVQVVGTAHILNLPIGPVPTNVSVKFNLTNPLHPLAVTVYGNVSGTVSRTANVTQFPTHCHIP